MKQEDLIRLQDVPNQVTIPGAHLTYNKLWRWCTKGFKGTRLKFVRLGGPYFTTWEWLAEFMAAHGHVEDSTQATPAEPPAAVTPIRKPVPVVKRRGVRTPEQEAVVVQSTQSRLAKMLKE